jgi:hypothetical protein
MELMGAMLAGVGLLVAIMARDGELQSGVGKFHIKVVHVEIGTRQNIHSEAPFAAH